MLSRSRTRTTRRRRRGAPLAVALVAALSATLALVPLAPASAEPEAADPPVLTPPDDVVGLLEPDHPRLMVDDAALAGIAGRIASDDLSAELYDELVVHADELLAKPVSVYEFPDGRTLLIVTREVQTRLYVLSMAYRLTQDERYAARAYEEMAAAAAFPDWNPVSFLSVAELLNAFAVGYDWLYEYMDDAQRQVVRDAIVTFGLEPAIAQHESGAWWTTATNNWNIVCNGGMIMAALAIGDEEPELANTALHHAFDSLPVALAEYGPDGGFPEGIVYWGYATRFLVPTMASLETAVGDDFGITETPGLDRTVEFGIHMTGPAGLLFNYYDASSGGHTGAPATHWLAAHYDEPAYSWWAEQGAAVQTRPLPPLALMWQGLLEPVPPSEEGLPLDREFEAIETFLSRSAWNTRTANYYAFKAGDNASSHSDLDMGTFIVDALGTRWATELGAESYNQPGYWETGPEGRRWTYYRKRPEGQNTLVINPDATTGQPVDASGTLVATGSSPDASFAVADLSEAYAAQGVTSWRRGTALIDGRSRFVVQDEVTASSPVEAWWFMHTTADVAVAADGRSATLTLNGRTMRAALLDAPDGAQFSVMDAVPLPTSPNPDGQTPNTGVRKLVVTGPEASQFRLSVLLEPLPTGVPGPEPAVTDLADWSVDPAPGVALADLRVDGEPVEGFAATSHSYVVDRAAGAALPVVTAQGADGAPVTVQQVDALPGAALVCVGADGDSCAARYTVAFSDPFAPDVVASVVGVNPAEHATDHDLTTFWSGEGDGQWIQANLPELRTVDGVSLAWNLGSQRIYGFDVLVSTDGTDWTTASLGTSSGTTLELEDHAFPAVQARYVRVVGHGSQASAWNSVTELRVLSGSEAWPPPPEPDVRLTSLDLGGEALSIGLEDVTQLAVTAQYSDGSTADVDPADVTLSSSDDGVAAVAPDGRVVGLTAGTAEVAATYRDPDGRLAFARLAVDVADPTGLTLVAARDGYVRDGEYASESYAHLPSMVVKTNPGSNAGFNREAYLAFDVADVPVESLVSARLHVWAGVAADRSMEIAVHRAGTDWTEAGLTWDTRPGIDEDPVGSVVAPETRTELTVDVTDLVRGATGGELGLALLQAAGDTQAHGASVSSRESGAFAPVLELELTPTPCTREVTGPASGPLTVADEETVCVTDADVDGPVSVADGGTLVVRGSDVAGPVSVSGAARVVVTDSRVVGPVTSTGAAAVQWWRDVDVVGPVHVSGAADDVVLADVRIDGPLACSGNVVAPILLGSTTADVGSCS